MADNYDVENQGRPESAPAATTCLMEKPDIDKKVKRHSIHGMMEEENVIRPHQEMAQLSLDEKKFLLAVERGDVASTRRMLQRAQETEYININCVDPLGRSALLMAIDNENLEMVELLIEHKVETKDALLHAISEEFVEAVEVLLDHEETLHREGEPHSWEALPPDTATFTPDITPLILAAHRDNYEIIKILLDRGATLPMPHDVRCGCDECVTSRQEDSLRHSRSRINAYRALASPSLIALSSKDPILTAFELSWELRRLSFMEHEFKCEYQELRKQCQDFATALLDHTRSSYELEVLLNHDPTGPAFEHGERMHLNRLKLAIKLRQKKFVAHPNVQQLLASIWYEGLPGFRRKNMVLQALEIVRIGIGFPVFSAMYIVAPHSKFGQTLRKPFIKFICHSASYFTFLFLLILASQRIESVIGDWFGDEEQRHSPPGPIDVSTKRGAPPSIVECFILAWVCGLIWSEVKQLWDVGLEEYANDMWNVIDFVTNSLYVATVALRVVAYHQVQKEMAAKMQTTELPREDWDTWDPMLISEGLFSAANIFSSLKLVYIFSVNPYLGPLQVSLSRMVLDIMKFFFLYVLVLFAFSCGLNQLLWYYADMEKQRCPNATTTFDPKNPSDPDACVVWRRFANLFETTQTLFWAVFGLIDLDNFELAGIKSFTRFWGMLMFGTYSVINIVVLLNLLIAMMNHSYQLISVSSERADVEWKFARSKLWISYFEEGGSVPPPFNIIPTPKSVWYFIQWLHRKLCGHSRAAKKEHMRTIRRKVKQASERDFRYQSIMRNLVRRYVTVEQRKAEGEGVTEDDVNEIKQDISAFRCELIEILKNSGMNTSTASGTGTGAGGKKNRQKERRLMKGFNIAPAPSSTTQLPTVAEFMANLQQHHEHHVSTHHLQDIFGSTTSAIFGSSLGSSSTPKKSHQHPNNNSSSGGGGNGDHHTHRGGFGRLPRLHIKRSSSHKRRWGTLIEAAKSGRVSRLIGRSRSEDSVCNSHCRNDHNIHCSNHSHSNSPASDDITESPSDSNPSLVDAPTQTVPHSGIGMAALAALRKRRKKFSASRNMNMADSGGHPIAPQSCCVMKGGKKQLQRASSVPTRASEVVTLISHRHEQTQSQQHSVELGNNETLTPSTTEESVTAYSTGVGGGVSVGSNSREPLLAMGSMNPANHNTSSQSSTQQQPQGSQNKSHNGAVVVLPNLPGIQPVSGHNMSAGWL
ncbi:transient receptor potential-gamma protein isoform X1 [Cryptotermes secundus]|uniref:transient receptor potential-gamma protein isoform X1 n=1 Tax=Cryptotermes secundus TaxID=105785 RepID=UPI001454CA1B|nr:transient receptor potential-gamma protein isoform X1 [Cryptotermes secundus]